MWEEVSVKMCLSNTMLFFSKGNALFFYEYCMGCMGVFIFIKDNFFTGINFRKARNVTCTQIPLKFSE